MSHKSLYLINVTDFAKNNSTLKKGHKFTLISNNFCTDNRLGMLPLSHRWLFLGLLLMCGNHTTDTVELNEKQLRDMLESSRSVDKALDALQYLQLLNYTKIDFLMNRIDIKGKEIKVKENNLLLSALEKSDPEPDQKSLVATSKNEVTRTIPSTKLLHKVYSTNDLSSCLDNVSKTNLLELYPDPEFIKREFIKMHNWLIANPKKNNKTFRGWATFVSGWLDKGWPKYQASIPTNKAASSSVEELMNLMGWAK